VAMHHPTLCVRQTPQMCLPSKNRVATEGKSSGIAPALVDLCSRHEMHPQGAPSPWNPNDELARCLVRRIGEMP
jgi:hypothetical protein